MFLFFIFKKYVIHLAEATFWKKQAETLIQEHLNQKPNTKIAKNIILFIGDGLSLATITAARIFDGQRHGATGEENNLVFEKLKNTAFVKACPFQT